jgi:putative flippase GtrA
LAVGGAAFVLDAGVVWGLTHAGIGPYVARLISISVSIAFTFVLNRALTFRAAGPVTGGEIMAYVAASGVGMAINYAIYAAGLKLGLAWLPALALGTIIAAAFNFFAYGRIFKKP